VSKLNGERISDPIADDLKPALSPERVDRVWQSISAARAGGAARSRAPRVMRSPVFALAAAASVMVAGLVLVRELSDPVALPSAPVAPLMRADGRAIDVLAPSQAAVSLPLSDGSELWVDKDAVLAPLDVSDRSVVLHLVRGRTRFAVKPGGPRRWVIEAGDASVEVVGTRFTVERDSRGVQVRVEEGKVLVRSGALPDGLVRLAAGEQVRVPKSALATATGAASAPSGEAPPTQAAEIIDDTGLLEQAVPPSDQTPAPTPLPKRAAVQPPPPPAPAPDADALLAIADDARVARDYRSAIEALDRVIREHRNDTRAKLAAFTIGRIRDEQFHDLAGATLAYESALALGLSGSLAEDCYWRLLRVLDAQAQEGRVPRARVAQTAQQYLQLYPKGKYAEETRRHLEGEITP
jgi:transmembrane sensor